MDTEFRKTLILLEAIWKLSPGSLARFRVQPIRKVDGVFMVYPAMSGDQYSNGSDEEPGIVIDRDNFKSCTEIPQLEETFTKVSIEQYFKRLGQTWLDNLYVMNQV